MTTQFPLSTVVTVSVSVPPTAVNEYNTSNLALFTHEVPGISFGTLGYKLYDSPSEVATDFGSSSKTFKMANAIFSQNPNILQNQGQLIVILMENNLAAVTAVQTIQFTSVPTTGSYKLGTIAEQTTALPAGSSNATLQTALRLLTGWGAITVTGDETIGFTVTFIGVSGPVPLILVSEDSLQDTDGFDVFPEVTTLTPGVAAGSDETLAAAITRTQGLVQYFGVMESDTVTGQTQGNVLDAAAVIQALPLIGFFVSYDPDDIAPGGTLDLLRTGTFTQSRGIYYQDSSSGGLNAMLMMAAYAGRGLSVDFTGSLTTITMNLKQLNTIQPDPNIDLTNKTLALAAGADVYISISGIPEVQSSGTNQFFDNVYNQLWFAGAIQVALFNYLAQTSTKILQTEDGMTGLKGAVRQVCLQAVGNGYLAPGTWTSPTTFGNLANFQNNIQQFGFYIFSSPVGQQTQTQREDRVAPLIQVAAKEAGAIQSASVIVIINP